MPELLCSGYLFLYSVKKRVVRLLFLCRHDTKGVFLIHFLAHGSHPCYNVYSIGRTYDEDSTLICGAGNGADPRKKSFRQG